MREERIGLNRTHRRLWLSKYLGVQMGLVCPQVGRIGAVLRDSTYRSHRFILDQRPESMCRWRGLSRLFKT
jgi:hypothetical protein